MNNQRKTAFIVLLSMIISLLPVFSANAADPPKVGDVIGNVLHTNIKTFIDGQRIPSYNIKNKSAIILNDLKNYGFDVVYDNATRTSSVTHNPNKTFTPITSFEESSQPSGTVAFQYVYTNITAKVNGKQVDSFNIKGYLAIFFEDLKDYGTFSYTNATRESRFTSNKPANTGEDIDPGNAGDPDPGNTGTPDPGNTGSPDLSIGSITNPPEIKSKWETFDKSKIKLSPSAKAAILEQRFDFKGGDDLQVFFINGGSPDGTFPKGTIQDLMPKDKEISALQYFGHGYDIFGYYAQPESVKPWDIFDIDKMIEDRVIIRKELNTSSNYQIIEKSASEHSKSQATKVGVSGSYAFFKASVETNFSTSATTKAEHFFSTIYYQLNKYELSLKPGIDYKKYLLPEIKEKINSIDSQTKANTFFKTYGTHFITQIVSGGRLEYSTQADSSLKLSKEDFGIKTEAKFNAFLASANLSVEYTTSEENMEYFSKSRSTIHTTGGSGLDTITLASNADALSNWKEDVATYPGLSGFGDSRPDPLLAIWRLAETHDKQTKLLAYYQEYASTQNYKTLPTERPSYEVITGVRVILYKANEIVPEMYIDKSDNNNLKGTWYHVGRISEDDLYVVIPKWKSHLFIRKGPGNSTVEKPVMQLYGYDGTIKSGFGTGVGQPIETKPTPPSYYDQGLTVFQVTNDENVRKQNGYNDMMLGYYYMKKNIDMVGDPITNIIIRKGSVGSASTYVYYDVNEKKSVESKSPPDGRSYYFMMKLNSTAHALNLWDGNYWKPQRALYLMYSID